MESDIEQALVEVVAGHMRWGDEVAAQQVLAAIRNWLPEGVVLTRDGLARVERRGYLWPEGEPNPAIDRPYWGDERDVPLYALTPLEASDE